MQKKSLELVQRFVSTIVITVIVYLLSSILFHFLWKNSLLVSLLSLIASLPLGFTLLKRWAHPLWIELNQELNEVEEILDAKPNGITQEEEETSFQKSIVEKALIIKKCLIDKMDEIVELNDSIHKISTENHSYSNSEVEELKMQLLQEQKQIAHLRESLDEANKVKTEFLSNISHELRTPMNGIIGMTELLMDTHLDDEQSKFLEIVKNSGYNLLSLINNVLDFSYIESGNLEIEEIDFNIKSTLKNLVSVVTIKAEEKGLQFYYTIDSSVPEFIHSDPGRIRQLLNNILSNSVKFTNDGEISFECSLIEKESIPYLQFTIKDTGIGIPHSFSRKLYEKFSQADGSYTRSYGGTGLGLALTYELVQLMEGTIEFVSEENIGTEFTIQLPFTSTPKESKEIQNMDIGNLKIMLLDDNKSNLNVYGKILSSLNLDYDLFSSGSESIEHLKEAHDKGVPYDIAFVDMQMPHMSGLEVGSIIRANKEYEETSLIMLSSIAKKGDAKISQQAGFDAFLSKPINKSDIVDCLKLIQANKEHHNEHGDLITVHTIRENRIHTKRILLVEDNRTNVIIASGILDTLGYKHEIANDGVEAIERLEDSKFDLIFMDLEMPKLNGMDTTKVIRSSKTKEYNSLPIIAMTANSNPEIIKSCKGVGMNDAIVKPISSSSMVKVLQKWLK